MRDLLFTGLFLAMALMALRHAHLGMMLWVWSALFPPNEFLFGFGQGIPFNKIAVACTVLALLFDKRRNLTFDALLIWLLLFLGEVSLSFYTAATPPGWGGEIYERLVKIVMAVLFIRFTVVDRLRLHSILIGVCLAVGSGAVDEGLKFIISAGGHHVKGPASWGDENITAAIILMAMPIIFYLYKCSVNKIVRIGVMSTFIICIVAVIGTYSRGGFVGLFIFYAMSLKSSKNKVVLVVASLVLIGVGLELLPESWFERIHSTTDAAQDYSFLGRVIQWKVLTLIALDHPFLGGGILCNGVPQIWQVYSARLASELTFISTPPPTTPYASHSIYFQVLGENGFTGLFLFLIVFGMGFHLISDIKKRANTDSSLAWSGELVSSIRMSIVLFLITGAALPIPYLEIPYIFIGILSAVRNIQVTESKKLLKRGRQAGLSAVKGDPSLRISGKDAQTT
ncbi:putative O-glycosylation ligase, exosortase A system-associated [Telmatospirillum sp.]|uniref:putative O-glycosylation ligase, exosortase A system-associated n=1 Tax=Telmatospirillum sp. TaxID=2079197 RepID=UPI00284BAE82|nr:putative O-glycosylation ligase, exosortase A system-associated [Telmatospirillum sp.]MDR3439943.1 putative O-glycosylation ligase, exosortase A system-associated [Telmatospirillum sp.]